MQIARPSTPHTQTTMTATTPTTTPFKAQTTAAEAVAGIDVVAGIDLGGNQDGSLTNRTARCPRAGRSAQPFLTVRTISSSHSPGCLRDAVNLAWPSVGELALLLGAGRTDS
jgi:hypothetical protein